ncbi:TIGR02186 family protein [Aliiruegeria sabulilitoris]|uniref:TIGR02186 family protein n=1 Tax=Aliiruegeria sabulilitoris TaxID=1510458 RepID=UPI000834C184|nr:TIGR02186 family protein [Aliiruegeria sabulilitoris]NDR55945.1 hypothetical protein [Pseudoruegeria sp. M32A2M]
MRLALLIVTFLFTALPAAAQSVVADLSQSRVSITASFAGSHILVFGAVKHTEESRPKSYPVLDPIDVIVTVSGPRESVTVRKKDRRAGIWINAEAMRIDSAPTLYKIASSRPLEDILSETDDLRHSISIPLAVRSAGDAGEVENSEAFVEALIRIREDTGDYEVLPNSVRVIDQTLFRTDINLPANLVEGDYTTRIFLTRNEQVVADFTRVLYVRKVGIERWVYNLAQDQALIYGLLSLAIAIAAGWSASAAFRYMRGS